MAARPTGVMATESDTRVPGSIWRGTGALVAARGVATLSSFAVLALLARALPGDEFGRLTFYLVLLLFLEAFVDCGTSTAAIQRGAHDPGILAGAIAAARRVRFGAALAGTTIVAALALYTGEPGVPTIALATLLTTSRALEASGIVYHSEIRWRVPATLRAATAVLRLVLAAALVGAGVRTFGPFLLAHAAAGALGNVVLHALARPRIDREVERAHGFLASALPLAALGLSQQAYAYADNFVVRWFEGDAELGKYNVAMRLFTFLVLVAVLATNAALPWLTRRAREGQLLRASVRLALPLASCGTLAALALLPFAGPLLGLLFGEEFERAAPALRWLLGAAAVVHVGAVALTAALATGRSRAVLAITTAGLLLNLSGNIALVPRLGIEGAAVATFATELFVALAACALVAGTRTGAR